MYVYGINDYCKIKYCKITTLSFVEIVLLETVLYSVLYQNTLLRGKFCNTIIITYSYINIWKTWKIYRTKFKNKMLRELFSNVIQVFSNLKTSYAIAVKSFKLIYNVVVILSLKYSVQLYHFQVFHNIYNTLFVSQITLF